MKSGRIYKWNKISPTVNMSKWEPHLRFHSLLKPSHRFATVCTDKDDKRISVVILLRAIFCAIMADQTSHRIIAFIHKNSKQKRTSPCASRYQKWIIVCCHIFVFFFPSLSLPLSGLFMLLFFFSILTLVSFTCSRRGLLASIYILYILRWKRNHK